MAGIGKNPFYQTMEAWIISWTSNRECPILFLPLTATHGICYCITPCIGRSTFCFTLICTVTKATCWYGQVVCSIHRFIWGFSSYKTKWRIFYLVFHSAFVFSFFLCQHERYCLIIQRVGFNTLGEYIYPNGCFNRFFHVRNCH
jgi:hypothetical protein